MGNQNQSKAIDQRTSNGISAEEKSRLEEEKRNNRFSFLVGIVIAMVIIILFAIFLH